MPFLKKLEHGVEKVVETAAPIVGGAVGGFFGGPGGAAAGVAAGRALAKGVDKASKPKQGNFVPSSSSDVGEARDQDRARMKTQYGI